MCDTMVYYQRSVNEKTPFSFFAKNSDRDPDELQTVYLSLEPAEELNDTPYLEMKANYVDNSLKSLRRAAEDCSFEYKAVISRPIWMWGAEMGINERGLAIGNEAVFSREGVMEDGLLGMDLLRLALHCCPSAKKALEFIIAMVEDYGQGGDGGYGKRFLYNNSFLIKDPQEAYLLETSRKHWAYKRVEDFASISNSYSLAGDFDAADPRSKPENNFKRTYEKRIMKFLSAGELRQRYTSQTLQTEGLDLHDFFDLLRSHMNGGQGIKKGMRSICIHPGKLTRIATTSSMVVESFEKHNMVWFASSPHPCVSFYKPAYISSKPSQGCNPAKIATDPVQALDTTERLKGLVTKLVSDHELFCEEIKPMRDELESRFLNEILCWREEKEHGLQDVFKRCRRLEEEYLSHIEKIIHIK